MNYFFIPPPFYQDNLSLKTPMTLKAICQKVGLQCRASGSWTERLVEIKIGEEFKITAEAGSWGNVRLELPEKDYRKRYQIALQVLAYGLHDLVAKESIRGSKLNQLKPGAGRPKKGPQKSNRERQRVFRESKKQQQA